MLAKADALPNFGTLTLDVASSQQPLKEHHG